MSCRHISKYRCIETIAPNKNIWTLKIGHRHINLNYLRCEDVWNQKEQESYCHLWKDMFRLCSFSDPGVAEKSLYSIIEEDPLRAFNYIQRESMTQNMLPRLALYLSGRAIDILTSKIFKKKDIDLKFVEEFYNSFFSMFTVRRYTWFSLHILIKASKVYPEYFGTTLSILLTQTVPPNTLLNDFVEHISEEDCTKYMNRIINTQFTSETFNNIVQILYKFYKKSRKSDSIFQYMYNNLINHSKFCAYNKNFGSLMLYFVQNLSGHDIVYKDIKTMIEHHCTVYKNPTLAALDKHVLDIMAAEANFPVEYRIIIPRPSDSFQL